MEIHHTLKSITAALYYSFFTFELYAQPGSIDSSFGINGVVASYIEQILERTFKAVLQWEQKILMTCNLNYNFN